MNINDAKSAPNFHAFKVGDGASYVIGTDSYPMTVRKVSASGHALWVSKDNFRAKPGQDRQMSGASKVEGVSIPRDVPECEWEKYTLRIDGRYRPVGSCGYLRPGRERRDDLGF